MDDGTRHKCRGAVGYARVADDGPTTTTQTRTILSWSVSAGIPLVALGLDNAADGTGFILDDLIAHAESVGANLIACTHLARFSRDAFQLSAILGELRGRDVAVVAVDEGIDTRTVVGRLRVEMIILSGRSIARGVRQRCA